MTDHSIAAMELARSALREQAERILELEEALEEIISVEVLCPEGGHEAVAEIHCIARSILNKEKK